MHSLILLPSALRKSRASSPHIFIPVVSMAMGIKAYTHYVDNNIHPAIIDFRIPPSPDPSEKPV